MSLLLLPELYKVLFNSIIYNCNRIFWLAIPHLFEKMVFFFSFKQNNSFPGRMFFLFLRVHLWPPDLAFQTHAISGHWFCNIYCDCIDLKVRILEVFFCIMILKFTFSLILSKFFLQGEIYFLLEMQWRMG